MRGDIGKKRLKEESDSSDGCGIGMTYAWKVINSIINHDT